jgi:SecD/SecF fusion protein
MKLTSDQNFIDLFANAYRAANPNGKLAPLFANSNRNKLSVNASDAAVISFIKEEASGAMKQTYQVLRKRIDKFGVAQPNINLDENKGVINVELAGATDPERVRKYLQSTANLQFWEVYTFENAGIQNAFLAADKAVEETLFGNTVNTIDSATLKTIDSLRTLNDPALQYDSTLYR